MADTTWGVKVPEEMKEKIMQTMQESGLSGKEFLESMLQSYMIKEMKENQPMMAPDLTELQVVTNRIVAIYTNMGERLSNMVVEKDSMFNTELEKKEKTINTLTEKITTIESYLDSANAEKEEATNYALELKKQKKDLEDSLETHRALVLEYKEKNDSLTGILGEYQEQKKELDGLRKELTAKESKIQHLSFLIEGQKKDLEIAKKEIGNLKAGYEESTEKLKEIHREEMSRIIEKMEVEKERAILAIKAEYQDKLEEARAKSSDRIEALLIDMQEERAKKILDKKDKDIEKKSTTLT